MDMNNPRIRASPRHGGQEFFEFSSPVRHGGTLPGGGNHRTDGKMATIPALYLNITIFKEIPR